MKLAQLLEGVAVSKLFQTVYGQMVVTHDVEVQQIQYDSRKVQKGDCFIAIRGTEVDGHRYISDAVANGANVVVMEDDAQMPDSFFTHAGVVKVVVPNSRKAMAVMAANYYGHPSEKLRLIGVTGTNGKTTTTHIVKSILEAAGQPAGLVGTIEYRIGDVSIPATHTTPESLDLNELLSKMVDAGCTSVSMEVSSHALDQSRIYGLNFAVGVFTNLTQDHLDYHGSMEEYFRAKKLLFDGLVETAWGITNADDEWGERITSTTAARKLSYGTSADSDVFAREVALSIDGTSMVVHHAGSATPVRSALVGRFNVYNILAAFSTGIVLDIPYDTIAAGIATVRTVKGRFERIPSPHGWTAIIDYAHTPDALEKCLRAIHDVLPESPRGKIVTVFGAGGDRDRTKRPAMGRVAAALSDVVIVTSDNPRTEDPQRIIDDIAQGIARGTEVHYDADRRTAIETALRRAQTGDVVLIAGKGHEEYQVIGARKIPFSDRKVVEEFIHQTA